MEREQYMENKGKEIQEEVHFLLEEKDETKIKSFKLYEEIRDKISEIKSLAEKEKNIINRVKSIKESGARVYGVDTYEFIHPLINHSLSDLQKLANSTFGAEDFGEIPQERKTTIPVHKSTGQLQKENNQLLVQMISLLEEMKKDSEAKSLSIDTKSLSEALSSRYNGGLN